MLKKLKTDLLLEIQAWKWGEFAWKLEKNQVLGQKSSLF